MPVPEGQITGSQIWQSPIEPAKELTVKELADILKEVDEIEEEETDDL